MLLTKTELEEMVGYSLEELGVELTNKTGLYTYDVGFSKLAELFKRVRYLSYESGQNNMLEWTRGTLQ